VGSCDMSSGKHSRAHVSIRLQNMHQQRLEKR